MSTALAARRTPALVRLATSTDHKRIGLNMAAASLLFFLVGGVFALVMRTELAQPGTQVVSHDAYDQLFTMHGSTMIYLFVLPVALAAGLYFVPLQIGSAELSWPRAALAGFWLWLAGGATMQTGWLTRYGAGKAGWFSYYPLSDSPHTPGQGMDLWVIGVLLVAAGTALVAASLLATIVQRRAPGMSMLRIPVFTWSVMVSLLMVVTSFPALLVVMTLLFLDRQGVGIFHGFDGAIDYQHLFWFFGHPVVYVMFFPFLGMVAEAFTVNARRRFFGYRALVISLLVFASLSMAVWAHHMFATGGVANRYFSLTSTLLLVPAGVEYFDLIGTLVGGAIVLRTSLLFGVGFLVQFLIGGLSGIFTASPPLDYHATDTYIVVAHFHYTLMAGSVFGLFAGIYHWFGKVTGALLREGLGKVHFGLMLVGSNLTFFPMFLLGQEGMRRRIADYPKSAGWGALNLLETVGALPHRAVGGGVPRQRVGLAAPACPRGRRPVGRPHAGVGDLLAPSALELQRPAAGPLLRPAARPARPRARRPRAPARRADPRGEAGAGMKSAAMVLAAWTALLVGHVVLLWIWWQDPVSLEVSWISTAIVAAATVAVLLAARRHPEAAESEPPGAVRAVPDASVGAALTAIGVAVAAYGLVFGTGVLLMGAGLAAVGLVRLVAERRDERRATARALERSSRP